MFKTMVLCSVAAGLAISLAACGQSDEAKCKEYIKTTMDTGTLSSMPEEMKKKQFDGLVKQCVAAKKLSK